MSSSPCCGSCSVSKPDLGLASHASQRFAGCAAVSCCAASWLSVWRELTAQAAAQPCSSQWIDTSFPWCNFGDSSSSSSSSSSPARWPEQTMQCCCRTLRKAGRPVWTQLLSVPTSPSMAANGLLTAADVMHCSHLGNHHWMSCYSLHSAEWSLGAAGRCARQRGLCGPCCRLCRPTTNCGS